MGYLTSPYLLLICLQLLFLYIQCSAKLYSHSQSSALFQFKQLFSFDKSSSSLCDESYPKMMSWKEDDDCCYWDGVTCDMVTGNVIGLDLSCSWLYGNISSNSSLFLLPHLQKLNLAFNNFNYSKISSGFSQFPNLTVLNLSSSNFMGPIPTSIGNITQLVYLNLEFNNFSGHIPSSISNLEQLQYFNMRRNNLIGKIPDMFINLTQLSYLYICYNQLSGSIPSSIYELVNLIGLGLSSNNLNGTVELYNFAKLKKLKWLFLSDNSISLSTKLKVNSHFPRLLGLGLSACNISEFPDILRTQHQLQLLDLSENQIHGRIPSSFCNLSSIERLYLYNNSLRGQIPQCLGNSSNNLTSLLLNENQLEGPLPPSLANCVHLTSLDVGNNKINDTFPYWLGDLVDLRVLNLRSNMFHGSPFLCKLRYIEFLDLSNNNLIGPIPECLGNSTLKVLDMRRNNFKGNIPQMFAKSCQLSSLNLNGNWLEGPLPSSLVNCRHLEVLDVGSNNISDTFPNWLEILPELQVLILRSNRFWGPIDDTKERIPFPKLRIIDLSHNELTGALPTRYFDHFKAMMHEYNSHVLGDYMGTKSGSAIDKKNKVFLIITGSVYYESIIFTIKGIDMKMERILTIFMAIDLSCNQFQGGIPQLIGKLISLKGLNMSHNNLTGGIPSSLGNLTELEYLDLSSNMLNGQIPTQLANLKSLSALKLAYNQLEGHIPIGPQFNTFQNDSYVGNLRLCGFPLSESCNIDEAPTRFDEEDDASSWFDWNFAMMGYGSGVVIGLSIGYNVFATRRPRWFLKMIEKKQSKKVRRLSIHGRARRN